MRILFLGLSFLVLLSQASLLSASGPWLLYGGNCGYINATSYGKSSSLLSFTRPHGASTLCIKQEFDALAGHSIDDCVVPSVGQLTKTQPYSIPTVDPLTAEQNKCYTCTDQTLTGQNCIIINQDTGACEAYEYTVTRNCSYRIPGQTKLVDGNYNSPLIDKWEQCYGNRNPSGALMVHDLKSGAYKWDEKAPKCQNTGTAYQSVYDMKGYFDDIKLQDKQQSLSGMTSANFTGALLYKDTLDNYLGLWTHKDIIPTSYCSDEDSGCAFTGITIHSDVSLSHRQKTFPYTYEDIVGNSADLSCNSTIYIFSRIKRSCGYTLSLADISKFQNAFSGSLTNEMNTLIGQIQLNVGNGVFTSTGTQTLVRLYYYAMAKELVQRENTPQNQQDLLFLSSGSLWDIGKGINATTVTNRVEKRAIELSILKDPQTTVRLYYLDKAQEVQAKIPTTSANRPKIDSLVAFFSDPSRWQIGADTDITDNINLLSSLASPYSILVDTLSYKPERKIFPMDYPSLSSFPFRRDNESCRYYLDYSSNGNSEALPPLIDKIKPVARVTDQASVDNTGSGNVILDHNRNENNIGRFYAGAIKLRIDMMDGTGSTYTGNPEARWLSFSGASGVKSYRIAISQVRTADGVNLTVPKVVTDTINVFQFDASKNLADKEDIHTVTWDGKIKETGLYRLTIELSDFAGNALSIANNDVSEVYFSVSPAITTVSCDPLKSQCPTACDPLTNPGLCSVIIPTIPRCPADVCIPTIDPDTLPTEDDCDNNHPSCQERSDLGVVTIKKLSTDTPYADAYTAHRYMLTFYDRFYNRMGQRVIDSITQTGQTVYLDSITRTGESAIVTQMNNNGLVGSFVSGQGNTDKNGVFSIETLSYAPGIFETHFRGKLCLWHPTGINDCTGLGTTIYDANLKDDYSSPTSESSKDEFLHILTGAIQVGEGGVSGLTLGAENIVGLALYPTVQSQNPSLTPLSIDVLDFMETMVPANINFVLTSTGAYTGEVVIPRLDSSLIGALSSMIPEQTNFESAFNDSNALEIETTPFVWFSMDARNGVSKSPRYYLSSSAGSYGSGLTYGQGRLNRIYISGQKISLGKEQYTSTTESLIEGINANQLRDTIYKNAAIFTRGRTCDDSGLVVNGILCIKGNYTITSDTSTWDTLIVEDGDIIITNNFNTAKVRKAIVQINKTKKGDIRITPDVGFVGANIFTDGSIISVDSSRASFTVSNSARTSALQKQIVFYGSIFSRNTVGGAILGKDSTEYVLPKGFATATTRDLNLATQYDLSFLRMGNRGYDDTSSSGTRRYNDGRNESVVILINPDIIRDPMSIFTVNR